MSSERREGPGSGVFSKIAEAQITALRVAGKCQMFRNALPRVQTATEARAKASLVLGDLNGRIGALHRQMVRNVAEGIEPTQADLEDLHEQLLRFAAMFTVLAEEIGPHGAHLAIPPMPRRLDRGDAR